MPSFTNPVAGRDSECEDRNSAFIECDDKESESSGPSECQWAIAIMLGLALLAAAASRLRSSGRPEDEPVQKEQEFPSSSLLGGCSPGLLECVAHALG